ncbi:RluA family pseudouridine synthase [Campylobacter sp. 19-13652]|uniref:RluA family pseudouridine synthase n=1 Tax=Campylobacter sp. 19-13652 TaxID=2840180 RepID=UPI001C7815E2|nr:pseudouridine synthase [Campylobacter sp. 19-13652]BCX78608.1 hypothetical protein LBC_00700 [Campylobacter sp. 19-13652]
MAYERVSIGFSGGESAAAALTRLGYSPKLAQRLIDKGRLFCDFSATKAAWIASGAAGLKWQKLPSGVLKMRLNLKPATFAIGKGGEPFSGDILASDCHQSQPRQNPPQQVKSKTERVSGELFLLRYVPRPKGLKPIFECDEFGVFDKPSGVLSHPNGRGCEYSLYDEIYALWGESACVAHRLDKDTSGLIIVAKNTAAAKQLKGAFEARAVQKRYVALLRGRVDKAELLSAGLVRDMVELDERFCGVLDKSEALSLKSEPFCSAGASECDVGRSFSLGRSGASSCDLGQSGAELASFSAVKNGPVSWSVAENLNRDEIGLANLNTPKNCDLNPTSHDKVKTAQSSEQSTERQAPRQVQLSEQNTKQSEQNVALDDGAAHGSAVAGGSGLAERGLLREIGGQGEQYIYAVAGRDELDKGGMRSACGFDFAVAAPLELVGQEGVAKVKMGVKTDGKPAITLVRVLEYLPQLDATLVECEPLTGRQHQIRVHMFHMKHHILGDPLYGVSDETARAILDGEIAGDEQARATGWHRLCLHASWIKFSFAGREYEFISDDYRAAFGLWSCRLNAR